MIKKIFPSISSGVLVGRNSTLLTQIDYSHPNPLHNTFHTLLMTASRNGEGENVNIRWQDQKGTCEIWCSAISVHNQLSEPVEVAGGGSLAWLGSAGVTRGLSVGVTERVMGWGGTVTPAQEQEVERVWRERGREMRKLGAGREKKHMLAGEELALRWPHHQLSLSWEGEKIELCCL